jgi:hypothetical protein
MRLAYWFDRKAQMVRVFAWETSIANERRKALMQNPHRKITMKGKTK